MRSLSELLSDGSFRDISTDKMIKLLSDHFPKAKLESMSRDELYKAIELLLQTGESTETDT